MKVKVNFSIEEETSRKIDEIAAATYRGKGDTIDWLVAEAYERLRSGQLLAGKGLTDVLADSPAEKGGEE